MCPALFVYYLKFAVWCDLCMAGSINQLDNIQSYVANGAFNEEK